MRRSRWSWTRGFFSAANINDLYKHHLKFLIAAKLPLKLVEKHLDPVREKMLLYPLQSGLPALCLRSSDHLGICPGPPYKGDSIQEDRRMHLHLYYSRAGAKTKKPSPTGLSPCRRNLKADSAIRIMRSSMSSILR